MTRPALAPAIACSLLVALCGCERGPGPSEVTPRSAASAASAALPAAGAPGPLAPARPAAPPCEALFAAREAPPSDPGDLLYHVSRASAVPPAYPVSATSQWTPCEPGVPAAPHDLVCLPAAYVQEGKASMRALAFESDAPASPAATHDGRPVGYRGKVGFRAMIDAAQAEAGVQLYVRSGFRSFTDQLVTFRGWLAFERKQGLSYDRALRKVGTYSAREGHSEHQLGTTADLTFRQPSGEVYRVWEAEVMEASDAFLWVRTNAHRFGIVLTYPRDKTHITQYRWEPWHYRFVGVEAADTMARCGLTTEEYLRARFELPPPEDFPDMHLLEPSRAARKTAHRGAQPSVRPAAP